MIELTIIGLLSALMILQHFYWSRQVQVLIDKLMSRNYAEYEQSKPLKNNSANLPIAKIDDSASIEEKQILDQLNGMMTP